MRSSEWINLGILLCNALQDFRKREILLYPTLLMTAAGVLWMLLYEKKSMLLLAGCALPGILLLLLARLTAETVGYGDGIAVLCMGIWSGYPMVLYVFSGSMMLMGFAAAVILIGRSRIRSIPMVPFLLASQVLCLMLMRPG